MTATETSATPPTMAVIGGGPTGTMLAIRMAKLQWAHGLRVILIERQAELGAGSAFATEEPFHLLNVRARDMSALSEQPSHFFDWAATRIPGLSDEDFVPRLWYRQYLRDLLDKVRGAARGAVVIEHRHAEAVGIEVRSHHRPGVDGSSTVPGDRPVRVLLDDGTSVAADRVVVAISNLPPLAPSALGQELLNSRRYTANPWDTSSLAAIPSGAKVLLIGTGLTMVDVALWLRERRDTTSILAGRATDGCLRFTRAKQDRDTGHHSDGPVTLRSRSVACCRSCAARRGQLKRKAETGGTSWITSVITPKPSGSNCPPQNVAGS